MKLTRGRFDCYKSRNDYILPPIWSWTPFNSSSRASVCRGPLHSATHILCKPGSTLHSARHMLCKWCAGINLLVQHIGGNLNSVPCRRTPGARWLFPPIVIGLPEMGFKLELIWPSCCSPPPASWLPRRLMMQAPRKVLFKEFSGLACVLVSTHPCPTIFPWWRLKIGLKATMRPNPSSCQGGCDNLKAIEGHPASIRALDTIYMATVHSVCTAPPILSLLGSLTRYRSWLASGPLSNMVNRVGPNGGRCGGDVLNPTNVAHLPPIVLKYAKSPI